MSSRSPVLKSTGDLFRGSKGYQCGVVSNTFKLKLPDKEYYHYDLCIRKWDRKKQQEGEQIKNPSRTVAVVERLQTVTAPQEFNPRGVYDGAVNFFTPKNMSQSKAFEVRMSDGKFVDFTVTMNLVGRINPNRDVARFKQTQTGNMEHVVNLVQVYMRHDMSLRYYCPPTSKFYFKSGEKSSLRHGLELWPAIFQSVRLGRDDLYLNIDTGVGVFYGEDLARVCHAFLYNTSFSLRDLIFESPDESRASPPTRERKRKELETLVRFIKGLEVSVNFPTTRRYPKRKIVDVYPRAGRYKFILEKPGEGRREVTVEQYYQMAYGQTMRCPDAIGVVTRRDPFSVIPIEFCKLSQQMYKKVLDPENTSLVLQRATKKPHERFRAIEAALAECAGSMSRYGLQPGIGTDPIQIAARKLEPPGITFGGGRSEPTNNGQWNMRDKKFYQAGYISEWAVINFTNEKGIDYIIKGLTECCHNRGITRKRGIGSFVEAGRLHLPRILPGNPQVVEQALRRLEDDIKKECVAWTSRIKDASTRDAALGDMSNHLLVIAFLPFHAAEIRQKVKHWGDTKGFMTQCIRQKDPSSPRNKFNDQYYNNVALKINAKVGGVNFCPADDSMNRCKSAPMMIVGADVGHAAPGVERPSLASVVFSMDNTFSRYQAIAKLQQARMEAIVDLKDMMVEAFGKFWAANERVPERVIFFRDGVSEGEFSRVREIEVGAIHDAIREVGGILKSKKVKLGAPPKLTFIVVGKRHHLKFFAQSRNSVDQPPQGLVVDTEVTSPLYPNFYLQSHAGMLGTRKSSHYTVLHNENESFDADFVQGLAYSLCHLQARATKGVSIPAPVAYADLVCSRVEFHFSKQDLEYLESRDGVDIAEWKSKFRPAKSGMYFI